MTGRSVTVSSYRGTTLELTRGHSQRLTPPRTAVDTPGIDSLALQSVNEAVTRHFQLRSQAATVVPVEDTQHLARHRLFLDPHWRAQPLPENDRPASRKRKPLSSRRRPTARMPQERVIRYHRLTKSLFHHVLALPMEATKTEA